MIKGELGDGGKPKEHRSPRGTRVSLDHVSRAVIEQLQQDGRRPYAEIAESLGVTVEAVEQRVELLTRSGVMQIVAVTDPLQLGFARQAMVGVIADGPLQPIAEALGAIPEVDYVVITAGGFDILAEVVGESDAHLLELVASRIRPIAGVVSIHTFLYLELHKQTYSWGVREPR